jgi:hypothetical protein
MAVVLASHYSVTVSTSAYTRRLNDFFYLNKKNPGNAAGAIGF